MSWSSLGEQLDPDSPVRIAWSLVCKLDLDAWLADIKAIVHHVVRNGADLRLLVALRVFATLEGEGSARELARLCKESLPYKRLCGDVSVNYDMLADFRSQGGDKWDELNHRARARRWAADGATGGHPLGLADAGPRRASSSVEVHARFAAR